MVRHSQRQKQIDGRFREVDQKGQFPVVESRNCDQAIRYYILKILFNRYSMNKLTKVIVYPCL